MVRNSNSERTAISKTFGKVFPSSSVIVRLKSLIQLRILATIVISCHVVLCSTRVLCSITVGRVVVLCGITVARAVVVRIAIWCTCGVALCSCRIVANKVVGGVIVNSTASIRDERSTKSDCSLQFAQVLFGETSENAA